MAELVELDEDGEVTIVAPRTAARRRRWRPGWPKGDYRHDYHDPGTGRFAPVGYVTPRKMWALLETNEDKRMAVSKSIREKLKSDPDALTAYAIALRTGDRDRMRLIAARLRRQAIGDRPDLDPDDKNSRKNQNAWDAGNRTVASMLPTLARHAEPPRDADSDGTPEGFGDVPSGPQRPQRPQPRIPFGDRRTEDEVKIDPATGREVPIDEPTDDPDLRAIFDFDFGDGYTSRVTNIDEGGGHHGITGEIVDRDGNKVGGYLRSWDVNAPGAMTLDSFYVEEEHQGKGIGSAFAMESLQRAREQGLNRIHTSGLSHPDTDRPSVGGYTWARQGYDFNPSWAGQSGPRMAKMLEDRLDKWDAEGVEVPDELRDEVTDISQRLRSADTGLGSRVLPENFPTPNEVATLGHGIAVGDMDGENDWMGRALLEARLKPDGGPFSVKYELNLSWLPERNQNATPDVTPDVDVPEARVPKNAPDAGKIIADGGRIWEGGRQPRSTKELAAQHVQNLVERSRLDYDRQKDLAPEDRHGAMGTLIYRQRSGQKLDQLDQDRLAIATGEGDVAGAVERAFKRWEQKAKGTGIAKDDAPMFDDSLDEEQIARVEEAMDHFFGRPEVVALMDRLGMERPEVFVGIHTGNGYRSGIGGSYDHFGHRIFIATRSADVNEPGDVSEKVLTEDSFYGRTSTNDMSLESLIAHEFGHAVHAHLGGGGDIDLALTEGEPTVEWKRKADAAIAEHERLFAEIGLGVDGDKFERRREVTASSVSYYAQTNYKEMFAEIFAGEILGADSSGLRPEQRELIGEVREWAKFDAPGDTAPELPGDDVDLPDEELGGIVDLDPADLADLAKNADEPLRMRVADNRMRRGTGIEQGDILEVEYHSDDKAKIRVPNSKGKLTTYKVAWDRFDGLEEGGTPSVDQPDDVDLPDDIDLPDPEPDVDGERLDELVEAIDDIDANDLTPAKTREALNEKLELIDEAIGLIPDGHSEFGTRREMLQGQKESLESWRDSIEVPGEDWLADAEEGSVQAQVRDALDGLTIGPDLFAPDDSAAPPEQSNQVGHRLNAMVALSRLRSMHKYGDGTLARQNTVAPPGEDDRFDFPVEAIDELDRVFKGHDWENGTFTELAAKVNDALQGRDIEGLEALTEWGRGATATQRKEIYARVVKASTNYRRGWESPEDAQEFMEEFGSWLRGASRRKEFRDGKWIYDFDSDEPSATTTSRGAVFAELMGDTDLEGMTPTEQAEFWDSFKPRDLVQALDAATKDLNGTAAFTQQGLAHHMSETLSARYGREIKVDPWRLFGYSTDRDSLGESLADRTETDYTELPYDGPEHPEIDLMPEDREQLDGIIQAGRAILEAIDGGVTPERAFSGITDEKRSAAQLKVNKAKTLSRPEMEERRSVLERMARRYVSTDPSFQSLADEYTGGDLEALAESITFDYEGQDEKLPFTWSWDRLNFYVGEGTSSDQWMQMGLAELGEGNEPNIYEISGGGPGFKPVRLDRTDAVTMGERRPPELQELVAEGQLGLREVRAIEIIESGEFDRMSRENYITALSQEGVFTPSEVTGWEWVPPTTAFPEGGFVAESPHDSNMEMLATFRLGSRLKLYHRVKGESTWSEVTDASFPGAKMVQDQFKPSGGVGERRDWATALSYMRKDVEGDAQSFDAQREELLELLGSLYERSEGIAPESGVVGLPETLQEKQLERLRKVSSFFPAGFVEKAGRLGVLMTGPKAVELGGDSYAGREDRAFYSRAGVGEYGATIQIQSGGLDESTMLHEFGHHLEKNDDFGRLMWAFLAHRTGGERTAPNDLGYGTGEVSREDRFFDPYAGKTYGRPTRSAMQGSGAEIWTMGLEGLFRLDGYRYKPADDEYRAWVLGVLALAGKTAAADGASEAGDAAGVVAGLAVISPSGDVLTV